MFHNQAMYKHVLQKCKLYCKPSFGVLLYAYVRFNFKFTPYDSDRVNYIFYKDSKQILLHRWRLHPQTILHILAINCVMSCS